VKDLDSHGACSSLAASAPPDHSSERSGMLVLLKYRRIVIPLLWRFNNAAFLHDLTARPDYSSYILICTFLIADGKAKDYELNGSKDSHVFQHLVTCSWCGLVC
jgi:hypothetical protein